MEKWCDLFDVACWYSGSMATSDGHVDAAGKAGMVFVIISVIRMRCSSSVVTLFGILVFLAFVKVHCNSLV